MTPQNPSDISRMRISDAERDRAASILSDALAQGRLTPEEHSARLDAVFAAKTQADLGPLFTDLPGATAALAARGGSPVYSGSVDTGGSSARMVSLFSEVRRTGAWRVPARIETVAVFGGAHLDLREAVLPGGEIRIRATCILGGVEITVPPEMHVVDNGWALMGGREMPPDSTESASQDAPVLRISGFSILGGLSVRRKRRGAAVEGTS